MNTNFNNVYYLDIIFYKVSFQVSAHLYIVLSFLTDMSNNVYVLNMSHLSVTGLVFIFSHRVVALLSQRDTCGEYSRQLIFGLCPV